MPPVERPLGSGRDGRRQIDHLHELPERDRGGLGARGRTGRAGPVRALAPNGLEAPQAPHEVLNESLSAAWTAFHDPFPRYVIGAARPRITLCDPKE